MKTLAEKIAKRRKRMGITVEEVARLSGLSLGAVSQLESGRNTNPTLKTIHKLANALAVTPKTLI